MGWKRGYGIPGTRHAVSAEELENRLINIGRLLKSGERMLTALPPEEERILKLTGRLLQEYTVPQDARDVLRKYLVGG